MRALILSCNTGEGHNSCAKAIKEVFDEYGELCDIEDALRFLSIRISKMISGFHVGMYRYNPRLFQFGYGYSKRHSGIFEEKSGIYELLTLGSKKLYQFIRENEYDIVICTHVFASLIMTNIRKKYGLKITTYDVTTDYICNPGTRESCLDYYFIPDRKIVGDYLCSNISEEKIIVSGIPIRKDFYNKTDKKKAKEKFGIPIEHKHLLIMCGSMGCGPIVKITKLLGKEMAEDMELTIICGTNRRLKKRLEKEFFEMENVRIMGYVQDISSLMDSADLYLTKPGGISVSEAIAKKLPMVFVNAVAGCEEYNRKYFIKKGCAVTADTEEELVELCLSLLLNDFLIENMINNFDNTESYNATQKIYNFIREKHDEVRKTSSRL